MLKIGILGKAGTGKNSTAKIIKNIYATQLDKKINSKIIAFADPIKEIVLTMFPEADKQCLFGSSKLRSNIIDKKYLDSNNNPLTYRQALIDIGTKLGRSYNSNIWINNFDSRFKKLNSDLVIVSDVRFENEIEYLIENGFYIIKLIRNNDLNINHSTEKDQDNISETKFNLIIDNNNTFKYLKNEITKFLKAI